MLRRIDNALASANTLAPISDLVFRIMLTLIFILGGLGHFGRHQEMLDRILVSPWLETILLFGNPSWLLWFSGAAFMVAGLCLAAGLYTRIAALVLFATLIPITVFVHFAPGHEGPLLKNIAIFGALIHVFFRGPGAYALDNRFAQKPAAD